MENLYPKAKIKAIKKANFMLLNVLKITSLIFICAATAAQANTPPKNAVRGYVVAGAFLAPEYQGADDSQVVPMLGGRLNYGEYFYVETKGLGVRANFSPYSFVQFGPALSFNMGRDNDVKNRQVKQLAEIDDAFEGGFFIALPFENIWHDDDEISLEIETLADLSNTHQGALVNLSAGYGLAVNRRLRLGAGLNTTYATENYNQTYFGISPSTVRSSGLALYSPSEGFNQVGVSFTANYALTRQWGLFGLFGASKLVGDAADSPIVKVGDDKQIKLGLGLTYRF